MLASCNQMSWTPWQLLCAKQATHRYRQRCVLHMLVLICSIVTRLLLISAVLGHRMSEDLLTASSYPDSTACTHCCRPLPNPAVSCYSCHPYACLRLSKLCSGTCQPVSLSGRCMPHPGMTHLHYALISYGDVSITRCHSSHTYPAAEMVRSAVSARLDN